MLAKKKKKNAHKCEHIQIKPHISGWRNDFFFRSQSYMMDKKCPELFS